MKFSDFACVFQLHRRLLVDDHFGAGEPLNETGADGQGLIVRGMLCVLCWKGILYTGKISQMFHFYYSPDLSGRIMVWRGRLSVCLSTKLVDTIQTEPLQLEPSNLVHLLLMTRGRTLFIFKVRGQRSKSQATHCC